jgi:serine/threonine-protein kinase
MFAFAVISYRPASTAADAPTDRSIAVLPLTNLSGDASDNYLGIGLAEEMTRALAKAGARVIGRTSAGALQARGLDDRAIASQLGVGSLLSGSVQRAGDQLRISVTLSAADGAVKWSNAYDRPITNVFAVQDEIAREVARELLALDVAAGTLVRNETSDPEAHSMLLRGIVLWNRRSEQALRQAVGLFEHALRRDPQYARAAAWLALGNHTLAWYADDDPEVHVKPGLEAANRALALDSTVSEAHTSAASAFMMLGRYDESDRRFRRALSIDSTLATSWGWYGLLALRQGEFAEALRRIQRAVDKEPASLVSRTQIAQVMNVQRRYREADSVAQSVLAMDSTFGLAWVQRAEALAGQGELPQAIEIMEKRVLTTPGVRRVELEGMYAWLLATARRHDESRALLRRMQTRFGGRLPPVASVASALDAVGSRREAMDLLAAAAARHDPWLFISGGIRFDGLRQDPRATPLLAKAGTR